MATSSNPVLARGGFTDVRAAGTTAGAMTLAGTARKIAALFALLAVAAAYAWSQASTPVPQVDVGLLLLVGALGGFGTAIYTAFRPEHARYTAPVYAVLEGLLLGALSAVMSARYRGLPTQAVLLTMATFVVMLVAYRARLIRATERFKTIVVSCTAAIAMFYLIAFVMGLFGVHIPFLHEGGVLGIGFSLFVTGLAAFNLILDFDLIEQGLGRAPAELEWYAAFGLMVTLVWLYIEILRLLGKLRR
jgi:uncharacterized YccA/Bax inhibitor family protein